MHRFYTKVIHNTQGNHYFVIKGTISAMHTLRRNNKYIAT